MLCNSLTRNQSNALYIDVLRGNIEATMRELCRTDLFFLLTIACKRKDINCDFLYDRCREVEANPDGYLDLWAREHYKSTIITYGKSIQDILASHGDNPLPKWNGQEVTIGIFSHTRPIAKAFLNQIKSELEENNFLKDLFPDVLYKEPKRHAPTWSLDSGIQVKRKTNPKEQTVEAWGLVDGQPTSKHFLILNYDDVVTLSSVTTPEMIKKVTMAHAVSLSLGARDGVTRTIGTRYHYQDTYADMISKGSVIPRIHAATDDGTVKGKPVFLSATALAKKRRDFGPYVYACQMLQNPKEDSVMGFLRKWLCHYDVLRNNSNWNYYILVDPASKKNPTNDYTTMRVWGLAPDNNYYLVDGVRDRLNLTERRKWLFKLHRKWRPLGVGYEEYGLQADIEHHQSEMERQNYRFRITALGGSMSKENRIRRLVPIYEQGRMWLPHRLMFMDYEGEAHDMVQEFIDDEYLPFPVGGHDDMLDCDARLLDPKFETEFPMEESIRTPSITMEQEQNTVQTDYNVFTRS